MSTDDRAKAGRQSKSNEEKVPTQSRAKRTRQRLLGAAVAIFERDGFVNARVADIVAEAGVSHGTFYTYFDSKEHVFEQAADAVVDEIYQAIDDAAFGQETRQLIRAANAVFLDMYAKHARMLALIEQVATVNEHFREMRLELRHRLSRRVAAALRTMIARGDADIAGMDQQVLVSALAGMVDNIAYTWFVLKEPFPADAVETLDQLWLRALGIS